ncbi:MAG: hypothetical protein FJY80_03710 [Candidatus Aminicenantes bacterium]|nr:hypothetical protein [Candidatus Aminicenantes bacterium]
MKEEAPMPRLRGPALAAAALAVVLWLAAADTLVVKVQTTPLRQAPQFFSPTVATLKVGDKLELLTAQGAWRQVKTAAGLSGWVHGSAAEVPKFTLVAMSGGTKTQATAQEAALAGKGFNKEIEQGYRAKHGEVSFVWVEKMLATTVPPALVEEFIKKGKLGEGRTRP